MGVHAAKLNAARTRQGLSGEGCRRVMIWNEQYTTPMGRLELGKVIVMQSKEAALAS